MFITSSSFYIAFYLYRGGITLNIKKLLKENDINMSVKEFKGYTKKASKIYYALNRLEIFFKNIFSEVATDEDNSPI